MQLSLDAATATRAYPHTLSVADEALLRLGERLRDHDYRFTTTTPLTHSRVVHRGSVVGTPLMRVFGWSLPFSASDLPADVVHDLAEAKALARHGGLLRSKVRFSTLKDQLYAHSAFPTDAPDSVFFGPDTYRFARCIKSALDSELPRLQAPCRMIDVGCGSGAGGIFAAGLMRSGVELLLADINPEAVRYARVNAALNGIPRAQAFHSDLFEEAHGPFDYIVANPPYLVDDFQRRNYVGHLDDGRDVSALLRNLPASPAEDAGFVLMDFIEGVEMGVGAYFDGDKFLQPACLDWEHKRFFPGDLGELTGEMGTVATFSRSARFFEQTLAKIEPLLRRHGHCGYVNLNTIVNDQGVWPLEFTCRFGYPGFAILSPLQRASWPELLRAMVRRDHDHVDVESGFSVGVVLTVPPFPYSRRQAEEPIGMPILFDGALSRKDRDNIHYGEVALDNGELVTAGAYGWTMVATGCGRTIASARRNAYRLIDRVHIPNMRCRRDIGERLIAEDYAEVERLGLLGDETERARRPPAPPLAAPFHATRS